jgi:DNA-binding transcriptional LysR family regulator
LERSRRLRVAVADTAREIDDVARGVAGHARIGVAPTLAQYLLPAACRLFLAEAKDVTLQTMIGMYPLLREALKAGRIDFAVGAVPAADEFQSYPIVEDTVVVVAGQSHELLQTRARMPDLTAYRWVLPAASYEAETRLWLERAFDVRGLPRPRVQIETDSVSFLPRLIAETGLLSFVSRRTLGPGRVGAPLKEVPLKETTMRRQCGMIYRKDGYLPPAARRLEMLLRTQGSRLFFDSP